MKSSLHDIFEHHHYFNQKLADLIIAYKNSVSTHPLSLFAHIVNVHHHWNSRILNTELPVIHQIHAIEKSRAIDRSNYTNTLKIIDTFYPENRIRYDNAKGKEISYSIRQILRNITHNTTHRKQELITALRKTGFASVVTDYIFYI